MGDTSVRIGDAGKISGNRLPKRADFQRLTASRNKVSMPAFLLQAAVAPQIAPPRPLRIGFTASRKIGNAVARNRARRRLRALARAVMPTAARSDWDYVLVARQATLSRDFVAMQTDLRQALQRIGASIVTSP